MAVKLTKRLLDSQSSGPRRVQLSDSELPGFLVTISPTNSKTFFARYRAHGGGRAAPWRWVKLGRHGVVTVEEARAAARAVLARVASGEDPASTRDERNVAPTMSMAIGEFLADSRARRKQATIAEYRRQFDRDVLPVIGTRRVTDLQAGDLARLHSSMRDRPYLANRVIAALGAFFSWCETQGYRPRHSNPVVDVRAYPEVGRERFLSLEELGRLGDALDRAAREGLLPAPQRRRRAAVGETAKHRPKSADEPRVANLYAIACLRMLVLSGWRKSEALTLRWDAIDAVRRHAFLADTKTGRSARPLGAAVFELLASIPRQEGSPFVFPGDIAGRPLTSLTATWNAVRHATGLEDVRLHDLRHTAAAMAAAGGLSLPLIGALLGHRNNGTTAKYAHLADDPRRLAADRMSGDVSAALAGRDAPVVVLHHR